MKDNSYDYSSSGSFFEKPKWCPELTPPRNAPFSHTMDSHVVIEPIIFVQPADLPDTPFRITCTGPQGFNFDQVVTLHGALNLPTITSTDLLEGKIQKLTADLAWRIELGGFSYVQEQSGPHTAYITMGAPRETDQDPHVVTQNRMERAVQEAGAANSLNPHVIVKTVIQAQGNFALVDPLLNAWLVPDEAAPCESIVRYAENVAKMVDVPGTFEHKHIYAIETAPTTGIEVPSSHAGLGSCTPDDSPDCVGDPRHHPSEPWVLSLLDGGTPVPGCNAFEAVAKFTACDEETRFYPGGVTGKFFDNKDDVLSVFDSLSWVDWVEGECTQMAIVHAYPEPGVNPTDPVCPP